MNPTKLPLVTIITPVYNGASYLDDLILSVQAQDYPYIEHIIIDDGSTDNDATIKVLTKYSHIRWWTRPNLGQYATMNEGLLASKGEVICFISADDIMCPGAITKAITSLIDNSELVGVYGPYGYISNIGKKLNYFHPMRIMPTGMYPYSLHISHSSFYLKKEPLIQKELLFNDSLKYIGDYDWIVRVIKSKLIIRKIKNTLSMIRIHDHQTSKRSFNEMRLELFALQKKMGVSKLKASFFRKLWFFINFFNSIKFNGLRVSMTIINDRFRNIFS